MMRLSNLKTALHKFALAIFFATCLPFLAKADLGITVVTTPSNPQPGDFVTADFLVYNFDSILSMQYTIQWEQNSLQYLGIGNYGVPGLSASSFGTSQAGNGLIGFSWTDPNAEGKSLPDCSILYSITFLYTGGQIPPILINGTITPIEVYNGIGQQVALNQTAFCADAALVSGNIFNDTSNDCLKDGGENGLQGWKLKFEQNGNVAYSSTNANGDYNFFALPGDYDVTLILPQNNLWTACQTTQSINIPDNQPVTLDFAAQALFDCPQMQVDIAAPFLRRCFNSTYHVHYCNQGTVPAEDAYVEVTLDPFLSAVSSSIPWTMVNGQIYTFPIGDVAVGQCGSFSVTVLVNCDAVLGQTHCTEAHVFPDEICVPVNPLWDGSILDVTGTCDGDSVRFTITNIGDDMDTPVPFIVIEDDMVNFSGSPIQLDAGGSFVVAVPANGSTWRVQLDNAPTSPFSGSPSVSVEGCGLNGSGSFSLGFVTQFPQGDPGPFTDVDCQPNVGSYDPNDKTGYPNGFCAAHFIESATQIEYRIRFQNTGTDTAFTVVVRDTLPLSLDPATVQPGASSHAYDFELLGNGVVQFTFPNIMLPDSNVNEIASHGFVDFTASQMAGNGNGTVISNQAAIYFDFNQPVFTNTYSHTVANDFVQSAGTDGDLSVSGYVRTWYGAPVEGAEVTLSPTCPVYTDANGYYEFLQLDTADYVLFAQKPNLDKQQGVTVLDALMLRKLILLIGIDPQNLPYQYLAGELNGSGGLTTFDAVILPKMALGQDVGSAGQYWKFIDGSYVFPPTPNPLSGFNAPTSIQFDTLTESHDSINFKAVKPGDLLHESMVDSSIIKPYFFYKTNLLVNGEVAVELKANQLQFLNGFQFGLNWDPAVLSFSKVEDASMGGVLFNASNPGEIKLMAFGINTPTLPDSTTLFKLVFNALGPIGSASPLSLDETLLPFQVIVEDCKLAGATMENTTVTISNTSSTSEVQADGFHVKIAPNPVRYDQSIFIETTTSDARQLSLQIFDTSGRLLRNFQQNFRAGTSQLVLPKSLDAGIYLLKVTDEQSQQFVTRLVVL